MGLLGLAVVTDVVISKNLQKSAWRMLIGWNEIYSGDLQSNVVIVGNSRAWVHYNPDVLDSILNINSYNLGMDGSAIDRQILKYDAYRRIYGNPKLIIQNIDIATMGMSSGYEREQFFPYFFDDSLRTAISEYEKISIFEQYLPAYRYSGYTKLILVGIGQRRELWGRDKEYDLTKGYFGMDKNWDGSALKKLTEVNYLQDSLALRLFDKYLEKVYSQNIRVVFVYAPLYIGAIEKIKNIEGIYQMYDSIARKYNVPIFDYTYDPISYDTTYFYNAMHLNKKGAELFSAKLARDIDSIGILE